MTSALGRPVAAALLLVALLAAALFPTSAGAAIERVSVSSLVSDSGETLSADGRYVTFVSASAHLVPGDTNGTFDVFVHDRKTGETERVSVDSAGGQTGGGLAPSISADGRHVAFHSDAPDLVSGDTNGSTDVFVHHRETGETERVSVDGAGEEGTGSSSSPSISADGRHVAFGSNVSDLVADDTNGSSDVFVHDSETGTTDRISVDSTGGQGNGHSGGSAISADGRHVAFSSSATNLVPGDAPNTEDVFVHDRETGKTERVSINSAGYGARISSSVDSIGADGRHVTFYTASDNLVPGDTNGTHDVFVHDRQTGRTERVSVDSAGGQANGDSFGSSISADGRRVAFHSTATDLVPGDTNAEGDIFVHDRDSGRTERVNVDGAGGQANSNTGGRPSISADGRHVAFHSFASNLVPGDTNSDTDVFVHTRDEGSAPAPADCTITGTPGDDVLSGTTGPDVICGLGGDDELSGRAGDDVLRGGEGDDELSGGAGADRLEGAAGADKLSGSLGDDSLSGGADDDRLYGREGLDTLSGDDGDDSLWGSIGDDSLSGGAENDELYGGEGFDALLGDDGEDSLHGDEGADELVGGAGVDEASYSSRTNRIEVTIGDGANDGEAGEGDDVQSDVEQVRGGWADDRLVGSGEDNLLSGGDGDDELIGAGGRDELSGGDGDDRLDAQLDDDESEDRLRCGGGLDTALSNPEDLVSSSCERR